MNYACHEILFLIIMIYNTYILRFTMQKLTNFVLSDTVRFLATPPNNR